jgi:hypothetical protein
MNKKRLIESIMNNWLCWSITTSLNKPTDVDYSTDNDKEDEIILLMITPTTAFSKIGKLKAPVRVIQGGTSAGKPIQYYNTFICTW